jgi:hypothetical protein
MRKQQAAQWRAAIMVAVMVASVLVVVGQAPPAGATNPVVQSITQTCGGWGNYTVPAGAVSATVVLVGGGGGGGGADAASEYAGTGGGAGRVSTTVPVTAGNTLALAIGCGGGGGPQNAESTKASGGTSVFGVGGTGGLKNGAGAGGGGASALCVGTSSCTTPLVVAGGGGGGGAIWRYSCCYNPRAGSGGGAIAGSTSGASGGNGSNCAGSCSDGGGGGGATTSAAGSGGINSGNKGNGSAGSGRNGGGGGNGGYAIGGGGGGGGYLGGGGAAGGGQGADLSASGGGGGAGSSYSVAAATYSVDNTKSTNCGRIREACTTTAGGAGRGGNCACTNAHGYAGTAGSASITWNIAGTQLVVTAQPPASTTYDEAFSFSATVRDPSGNAVTNDSMGTPTYTYVPGAGCGQLAAAGSVSISNGVVTVSGVKINTECSNASYFSVSVPNNTLGATLTATTNTFTSTMRPTVTSLSCSPGVVTAGSPTTCTVTVTDSGAGTKRAPAGSITFNGSPKAAIAVGSPCALVAGSTSSTCTQNVLIQAAAAETITASYTPSNAHSASSQSATVTVNVAESPIPYSPQTTGGTGSGLDGGATVDFFMSGCAGASVWGGFVSFIGDPGAAGGQVDTFKIFMGSQGAVAADGSMSFTETVDLGGQGSKAYSRWFCAAAEPTSYNDPTLWKSPMYEFTQLSDVPSMQMASLSAAAAGGPDISLSVDPDSLPAEDRLGIVGPVASKLKDRVDALVVSCALPSRVYQAFLGRPGDHAGLAKWTTVNASGGSLGPLADTLAKSTEFKSRYSALTDRQFVTAVYLDVLGRAPTSAEANDWVSKLSKKKTTRARLVLDLTTASESETFSATRSYVICANQALGTITISSANADRFQRQLESSLSKVGTVESIALTIAPAATWTA